MDGSRSPKRRVIPAGAVADHLALVCSLDAIGLWSFDLVALRSLCLSGGSGGSALSATRPFIRIRAASGRGAARSAAGSSEGSGGNERRATRAARHAIREQQRDGGWVIASGAGGGSVAEQRPSRE